MSEVADRIEAAGLVSYGDPAELTRDMLDPLIADAVLAINKSGWVWTTESCQGHPDADYPSIWAGNTDPYIRFVCDQEHTGELMKSLFLAGALTEKALAEDGIFWRGAHWKLSAGWPDTGLMFELYCYVAAKTSWERDAGIRVFETLAEILPRDEP